MQIRKEIAETAFVAVSRGRPQNTNGGNLNGRKKTQANIIKATMLNAVLGMPACDRIKDVHVGALLLANTRLESDQNDFERH